MNKINTSQGTDPNNQQPFPAPSLAFLQNAYMEAIQGPAAALIPNPFGTDPVVLWGCVNTGTYGTNFNISAGAIYYLGEIYLVSAFSFVQGGGETAVCTITTTNPSPDPIKFQGGGTYNVHDVRRITIASAATGTGTFDFSACLFVNEIWKDIQAAAATVRGGNNGLELLPDFANSWTNTAPTTTTKFGFKIDRKRLWFKGTISGGASGTSPIATPLTAVYRPLKNTNFSLTSDGVHVAQCSVLSDGSIAIAFEAGASYVSFDGCSIALD